MSAIQVDPTLNVHEVYRKEVIINPYRFGAGAPAAWNPSDDSSLYQWYDASDEGSITVDTAGVVSQLNDKSGNSFHITPTSGGPISGANTVNGKNVIDFTEAANGDTVLIVNVTSFPSDFMINFVGIVNDASVDSLYCAWAYDASSDFQFQTGGNTGFLGVLNDQGLITDTVSNGTDQLNELCLWTIVFDSTGNARILLNGIETASDTVTNPADSSLAFRLGGNRANNRTLGMQFCEYTCSSDITQTNIDNHIEYMMKQWGILAPTLIYTSDFTASVDGWSSTNTITFDYNQTIDGSAGWLYLQAQGGGFETMQRTGWLDVGKSYRIMGDIYIVTGSLTIRVGDGPTAVYKQVSVSTGATLKFDVSPGVWSLNHLRVSIDGSPAEYYLKNVRVYELDAVT